MSEGKPLKVGFVQVVQHGRHRSGLHPPLVFIREKVADISHNLHGSDEPDNFALTELFQDRPGPVLRLQWATALLKFEKLRGD